MKKILPFLVLLFWSCKPQQSFELLNKENPLTLVSDQFAFTEGPAVDQNGNIYFTDQPNDKIYLWNWQTNNISLFSDKTGRANGTYVDKDNNLITMSDEKGEIWKFNPNKTHEILNKNIEGKRMNGPNDLWIDAAGGFYFTDPLYERNYWQNFVQEIPEKNLYYRQNSGTITKLDTFVQPNGIIGSEKLKKLYVSDIDAGKTYVYDIVGNGQLNNKKLFCEMGSDGMTLDEKGNLYLTNKGVTVFNPKGEKILHIPVNEEWTANVTFGGKNNKTLFITASKSVYTLEMNVKGID